MVSLWGIVKRGKEKNQNDGLGDNRSFQFSDFDALPFPTLSS